MHEKIIRVGGASGFWGESAAAVPQLLGTECLDYLVFDYLAEITMSIMARARARDPDAGFARDFVSAVLRPNLTEIAGQGVRVISNAGGVNPLACGNEIRKLVDELGLELTVAVVAGDDLSDQAHELADAGVTEMFSGAPAPAAENLASVNAYLGAFPIARALAAGADIVVTGRVVDSAVTLGAAIHEFGWQPDEYDKLAGGSLAGHILECTAQATGGNFTDWELVADTLHVAGYPIGEISSDGSFVCTKPRGSGGMVSFGTVAEQLLYEIGDPQAYVLPDVVCDFSAVTLAQIDTDRVSVSGARGRAAPDSYKVSATYADGFSGGQLLVFYGADADRKARSFADAAIRRTESRLRDAGLGALTETSVELIGDESHYGAARKVAGSREVALKIAAKHPKETGIRLFLAEIIGNALAAPPGLTGFAGGRPKPSPVVRLFSFLLPKTRVSISVDIDGSVVDFQQADQSADVALDVDDIERPPPPEVPAEDADLVQVPLIRLAFGRSGDKGNNANIGIIARRADYLPYIWNALTEEAVAKHFAHFLEGPVERFLLPGPLAINFLLHDVLGGGGIASLRNDPQGKGYAQLLLDYPIPVPPGIAAALT